MHQYKCMHVCTALKDKIYQIRNQFYLYTNKNVQN